MCLQQPVFIMDHGFLIPPAIRVLLLPQVRCMAVYAQLGLFTITVSIPHAGIPSVRQSQNAVTIAVTSSLVVFIFSSTLFFIIGCVCGWFGHKHKTKGSDMNTNSQPGPLYEDLQPSTSLPGDQEKVAFELKENIAYGPIQLT